MPHNSELTLNSQLAAVLRTLNPAWEALSRESRNVAAPPATGPPVRSAQRGAVPYTTRRPAPPWPAPQRVAPRRQPLPRIQAP